MYTVCWFPWHDVVKHYVSRAVWPSCVLAVKTVVSHRDCVVSTSQDGEVGFLGATIVLAMPLVSGSVPDGRQQTNHPLYHAPRADQ